MSRQTRYLCGVPERECQGTHTMILDSKWQGSKKTHTSHEDARACYVHWLLKRGYTRLSSSEFALPDGGPILIINRVGRFGGKLRRGKEGRFMTEKVGGIVY